MGIPDKNGWKRKLKKDENAVAWAALCLIILTLFIALYFLNIPVFISRQELFVMLYFGAGACFVYGVLIPIAMWMGEKAYKKRKKGKRWTGNGLT